jgi:hypothetical protein
MNRTIIKLRNDRMKTQTEESSIKQTLETVTFNMSMIKRTNPKFYQGILRIYNQVPFFLVDKKEENKNEENNENKPNAEVDKPAE